MFPGHICYCTWICTENCVHSTSIITRLSLSYLVLQPSDHLQSLEMYAIVIRMLYVVSMYYWVFLLVEVNCATKNRCPLLVSSTWEATIAQQQHCSSYSPLSHYVWIRISPRGSSLLSSDGILHSFLMPQPNLQSLYPINAYFTLPAN